jgi:hypothetical protein
MGTGCKPVGVSLRWFDSNPAQLKLSGKMDVSLFLPESYFVSGGRS